MPAVIALCGSRAESAALRVESLEARVTPAVSIGANFAGQSDTLFAPPDADGSIGPNYYVQFINRHFSIYTKSGVQVATESDTAFWTAAGIDPALVTLGVGDPRVLYDPVSGRWFATENSFGQRVGSLSFNNSIFVARSNSSDPTAGWAGTSFPAAFVSEFADLPTLGVDANGLYIGTNNFFDGFFGDSVTITSIPKANLLLPTPTVANRTTLSQSYFSDSLGFSLEGVTNFNPSPAHGSIVAVDANFFGEVDRTTVSGSGGPGATFGATTAMTALSTSNPHRARQPDGSRRIDAGDGGISSMVYQVGDLIYSTHTISVNAAGVATNSSRSTDAIRLTVISDSLNQIVAEGTYFNTQFDYTYPSVAANAAGDIIIGFTRSGRKLGSGATSGTLGAYAVHAIIDPANPGAGITFGQDIQLKAGVVKNYHLLGGSRERWGDYSATGVDPTSSTTFWTTQEYAAAKGQWGTQITELFVSPGLSAITSPVAAGNYGVGAIIPIQLHFDDAVVVTGTPRLDLNAGSGASAVYASGSGTDTLTFNYAVAAGQNAAHLDYASHAALALDGGTIRDQATGLDAVITLAPAGSPHTLGATSNLVIVTDSSLGLPAEVPLTALASDWTGPVVGSPPASLGGKSPDKKQSPAITRPLVIGSSPAATTRCDLLRQFADGIPSGLSIEGLSALVDLPHRRD